MKLYVRNILVGIDQLVNTIIGGDPDETISSRIGKCQRGDFGRAVWYFTYLPRVFVDLVFYYFDGPNHCRNNIEEDEGKDDLLK